MVTGSGSEVNTVPQPLQRWRLSVPLGGSRWQGTSVPVLLCAEQFMSTDSASPHPVNTKSSCGREKSINHQSKPGKE